MHHLDNWLFVLFVAVAMLFRWLASAASKSNKGSGETNETERKSTSSPAPPLRPARGDSQEEQIRKFLEALGRPTSSSPPPLVRPKTHIPPRPVAPVQPPREMVAMSPRKRRAPAAPKIEPLREPPPPPLLATPEPSPTPAYAIAPEAELVRPKDKIDIVTLLKSSSGLRNAMVLREIFGPPRSLQDINVSGIA